MNYGCGHRNEEEGTGAPDTRELDFPALPPEGMNGARKKNITAFILKSDTDRNWEY